MRVETALGLLTVLIAAPTAIYLIRKKIKEDQADRKNTIELYEFIKRLKPTEQKPVETGPGTRIPEQGERK